MEPLTETPKRGRPQRKTDKSRTLTEWLALTKKELTIKATSYGLAPTGTKKELAHRLYWHLRPPSSSTGGLESETSARGERGRSRSPIRGGQTATEVFMPVHTQQVTESNLQFNQDSLHALIREELAVALAPANNSITTPQVQTSRHQPSAQLSPPSPISRVG